MTRQKAIYRHCRECSGEDRTSQVLCHLSECPLWPYRLGCSADRQRVRVEYEWSRLSAEAIKGFADLGLSRADFMAVNRRGAKHSPRSVTKPQEFPENASIHACSGHNSATPSTPTDPPSLAKKPC